MRLKNYVFFRETGTGVWFDAGRRSFALNGKGIYPVVERLLSALEASGRSPDALVAELPARLQELARRLFDALEQHDMLQRGRVHRDDKADRSHSAYAEFLRYLEDHSADGALAEALSLWRKATVVVVGDGYAAKAAIGVLADCGCGRILLRCTSAIDVDLDEIRLSLQDRSSSEVDLSMDAFEPSAINGAIHGVVIAGSQHLSVDHAITIAGQAQDAGITVSACLPINGHLAVLSVATKDMAGIADLADWLLPAAEPVTPSPVNLAIAGSIASQDMVARFFGITAAADATARIVSPYSEVEVCPIPVSPRRHVDGMVMRSTDLSARIEMPEERDLSRYEQVRMALAPWMDPATPVLDTELPEALPQLPLHHDAFSVRRAGTAVDGLQLAVGWGLTPEDAGFRAAMNAVATLAEQEFGHAHLLVADVDVDAWQCSAAARAFVLRDSFARDAVWGGFEAGEVDDAQVGVALAILQTQVSSPIHFRAGFVPGAAAFVVSCHAGDEQLSAACMPSLPGALAESVGLAISKIQLHSVKGVVRPDDIGVLGPSAPGELVGLGAVLRAVGTEVKPIPAQFVRSRRLGLPEAVVCGYAVVEQAP